jgi:nitrite reductase/ring-hydroxylating ferredoxin subunit
MKSDTQVGHEVKREVLGTSAPRDGSGALLDVQRYISPEFAKLEWDAVFTKTWQIACREDHVATPGDHFVFELGSESILVSRGDDGVVRAFYNVCRHRNNLLVRQRHGEKARTFACSYHRWTWDNAGRLRNIPDRELFPGLPDDERLGLKELKADVWGGFVFISMNPDVEPLRDYLHPIPEMLDKYWPERMALVQDFTVEWECNWKVGLDAFNETYHVAATHPQLLPVIDDYNVRIECHRLHNTFYVPYGIPSPRVGDRDKIPDILANFMDPTKTVLDGTGKASDTDPAILAAGAVDPTSFSGTADDVRHAVQAKKRESQDSVAFLPYRNLTDGELTDDFHVMCFPNTQFNVFAENILMFRHRPHPVDPNRCYYDVWYLSHVSPGKRPPLPPHATLPAGADLGMALNQDASNVASVQAGMRSRSTDGVYLGELETRIRHFHRTLDQYMQREKSKT